MVFFTTGAPPDPVCTPVAFNAYELDIDKDCRKKVPPKKISKGSEDNYSEQVTTTNYSNSGERQR